MDKFENHHFISQNPKITKLLYKEKEPTSICWLFFVCSNSKTKILFLFPSIPEYRLL
jgi:hypothetical protein